MVMYTYRKRVHLHVGILNNKKKDNGGNLSSVILHMLVLLKAKVFIYRGDIFYSTVNLSVTFKQSKLDIQLELHTQRYHW